ncbi:unnamed protein product [Darwinula stevensoni]|uniref:WAP domain-containing protein n=1 Tax=Darwinula stevensoni TaxID=69355 RepID=A0A7R8X9I8_9CRUS|nr:unnamed protein product [Darwinula stevensoni]CAG0889723.1 unnamed protein product [Darwinula stevensoni]
MKRFLGFLLAFSLLASRASSLGRCPPPEVGICIHGCSTDGDCPEGLLCCFNGCGYQCMQPEPCCDDEKCAEGEQCILAHVDCGLLPGQCPEMPFCVPDDAITCANVDCQPGYTCIMQEVDCVMAPCYPVPDCIPVTYP